MALYDKKAWIKAAKKMERGDPIEHYDFGNFDDWCKAVTEAYCAARNEARKIGRPVNVWLSRGGPKIGFKGPNIGPRGAIHLQAIDPNRGSFGLNQLTIRDQVRRALRVMLSRHYYRLING